MLAAAYGPMLMIRVGDKVHALPEMSAHVRFCLDMPGQCHACTWSKQTSRRLKS